MQDLYTDGFSMYLRLLVPIQFFVSIFIVDQENSYGKALEPFCRGKTSFAGYLT